MKKFNMILALILATQTAFAGVITDDNLDLGKPSSSATKSLTFKGPTKKKLSSTSAGALGYDGNDLSLGDGTNSTNKTITFNKGANSPSIKYNFATGTIQFSNDNVNFLDMGSGSGGSGGVQMLSDGEFEKATISTYWTPSAGTLTAVTSGGNFSGFDKQSASWVPAASSNTLSSETITIVNGLLGARGVASIYYKTGSALHTLQVYDGSTVLASKVLPANTAFQKAELYFAIPVSGTIQLRVLSGDTTAIYLDKAYMGPPIVTPVDEDFSVVTNLFPNPKAEGASPSWLAYKDAAAVSPVDGVSGSPTLTCTISSSSPLEGTRSFLITKPASNVQGEGCAHNLKALNDTQKAKVIQVSFDYKIASGTYTDDSLKLYAYDIDNATLIELAPTYIKNSGLTETARAVFQSSLTGVNYRLIWHYAGTDTVATSIKIDNLRVSTQILATGSFATDWIDASSMSTAGFIGLGSVSVNEARYKIIGDTVLYQGRIATGTHTAVPIQIPLPSGLIVDAAKCTTQRGIGVLNIQTGASGAAPLLCNGSATLLVGGLGGSQLSSLNGTALTSSNILSFFAEIPIAGRTSSTALASEYNLREVYAKTTLAASSIGSGSTYNTLTISGSVNDPLGIIGANTITIPVSGQYRMNVVAQNLPAVGSGVLNLSWSINGVGQDEILRRLFTASSTQSESVSTTFFAKAGDVIRLRGWQNSGSTQSGMFFQAAIEKIGGGSPLVAQDPTVNVSYQCDSGQTLTATGVIKFNQKLVDNWSAYNTTTGLFTAPISGTYEISYTLFSITATSAWQTQIRKNQSSTIARANPNPMYAGGTTIINNQSGNTISSIQVKLLAGETLDIHLPSSIATGALYASIIDNYMSIKRVGNY